MLDGKQTAEIETQLKIALQDIAGSPVDMDRIDAAIRSVEQAMSRAGAAEGLGQDLRALKASRSLLMELDAETHVEPRWTPLEITQNPALFDAIDDGDLAAVRVEMAEWDLNRQHGRLRKTALYHAMAGMDVPVEILEALLDAGADPRRGMGPNNVLHALGFAILDEMDEDGLARVVARCVAGGAELEQRSDSLRWTPLQGAITEWNPVAVRALLRAGADPDAVSGTVDGCCLSRTSCLAMAMAHPEIFEILLDFGADPDRAGPDGTTPRAALEDAIAEADPGPYRETLKWSRSILTARTRPVCGAADPCTDRGHRETSDKTHRPAIARALHFFLDPSDPRCRNHA